jgi:hypothetical protein
MHLLPGFLLVRGHELAAIRKEEIIHFLWTFQITDNFAKHCKYFRLLRLQKRSVLEENANNSKSGFATV